MQRAWILIALALLGAPAAALGAELDEARSAYEAGRYVEAHGKLLAAARKGEREAQEMLGIMYAFGEELYPGVKRNPRAALGWLQRAAGSRHATPRYLHCALLRKQAGKQLAPLHCFDPYSDPDSTGQPQLMVSAPPANPEGACIDALASKPEFAALSTKVALAGVREQPFSMMLRTDRASDADKPLIRAWIGAKQDCFIQGQNWRQRQALPLQAALADTVYSRFLALTRELYAANLTYGDYAQARVELSVATALGLANAAYTDLASSSQSDR